MNGNQLISLFHAFSLLTTRRSSGEVKKRVRPRSGRLSPNFHRFLHSTTTTAESSTSQQTCWPARWPTVEQNSIDCRATRWTTSLKQHRRLFTLRTSYLLKSWLRIAKSHFLVYVCLQTSPLWCIYWGNLAKACRKCKWWMQVQRKYSVVGRTWTAQRRAGR